MRKKIAASSILPKLIDFAEGRTEMTPAQAATGLKLVGKILPDLQSISHDVTVDHKSLSVHELNGRLASLGYDPQQVWNQLNGKDFKDVQAIDHQPSMNDAQHIDNERVHHSTPVDNPVDKPVDKSDDDQPG
jgi:hypothetical protein